MTELKSIPQIDFKRGSLGSWRSGRLEVRCYCNIIVSSSGAVQAVQFDQHWIFSILAIRCMANRGFRDPWYSV